MTNGAIRLGLFWRRGYKRKPADWIGTRGAVILLEEGAARSCDPRRRLFHQVRCLETAAVILNIEICSVPITAPSFASGLI